MQVIMNLQAEKVKKIASDSQAALQALLQELGMSVLTPQEDIQVTEFTKKMQAKTEEILAKVLANLAENPGLTLAQIEEAFASEGTNEQIKIALHEFFSMNCFQLLLKLQQMHFQNLQIPKACSDLFDTRMKTINAARVACFVSQCAAKGSDAYEMLALEARKIKHQNEMCVKFHTAQHTNPAKWLDLALVSAGRHGNFYDDFMLGTGLCYGACLDLIIRKLHARAGEEVSIQPTPRARFFETQHFMYLRQPVPPYIKQAIAKIETVKNLYAKCSFAHEILVALQPLEEQENPFLKVHESFIRYANERGREDPNCKELQTLFSLLMGEIKARSVNIIKPMNALPFEQASLDHIGIQAKEVIGGKTTPIKPLDQFLDELNEQAIEQLIDTSKGGNMIFFLGPPVHAIYCSLAPPYEIQDVNVPGFTGFRTNDLEEFKLYLAFWVASCKQQGAYPNVERLFHLTKK